MTTATLATFDASARLRQLIAAPLWMWCVAAVAVSVLLQFTLDASKLLTSLGDTDDATRLIQVRELLAGAPWFDTTLPRLGAPEHLVSHWSRLVDVPLAALLGFFSLFLPQDQAELAMRTLWPVLLLFPLFYVVARTAEARGGRSGAIIALALTLLSFAALVQFRAGRIDHHNLQNLAALAGVCLLASSFANPRHGIWAGIVLGLGMAVGFEAMLVTGAALAIAALVAVTTGRGRQQVSDAAFGFVMALAIAFLLTTAPSRWLEMRCDALSLNMVLLAATSAAGLGLVLWRGGALSLEKRLAGLAAAAVAGIATYGMAEPACLAGPFGQVDPAVYSIWLAHVSETKSFVWLAETMPATAIANALHVIAGLVAAWLVVRKDRDGGALFYAAVLTVTAVLCVLQAKLMPYAALLAIPPLAIVIARIPGNEEVSAATLQGVAAAAVNQKALLLVGALLAGFNPAATEAFKARREGKTACTATEAVSALAGLGKGLAVSDPDYGPYIVALTKLDALAGPYHRIDKAIIEAHGILNAAPEAAKPRLAKIGAAYVVLCSTDTREETQPAANSLRQALLAGDVPAYLEPVTLTAGTPLRVWRVK